MRRLYGFLAQFLPPIFGVGGVCGVVAVVSQPYTSHPPTQKTARSRPPSPAIVWVGGCPSPLTRKGSRTRLFCCLRDVRSSRTVPLTDRSNISPSAHAQPPALGLNALLGAQLPAMWAALLLPLTMSAGHLVRAAPVFSARQRPFNSPVQPAAQSQSRSQFAISFFWRRSWTGSWSSGSTRSAKASTFCAVASDFVSRRSWASHGYLNAIAASMALWCVWVDSVR